MQSFFEPSLKDCRTKVLLQDYYFFRRDHQRGMNWQPFGGELREYGQEFKMNYN